MDVHLPDIDGYEAARRIAPHQPETVIVLVSAAGEALVGDPSATCGASAFVRKEELRPSLLRRPLGPASCRGRERPNDACRADAPADDQHEGHGLGPGRIVPHGLRPALRRGEAVHEVAVDGFWIDVHQVTVAEFRRFVKATGHVTVAERPLDPADYPDADPALLVPGSLVFHRTPGPVEPRRLPELVGLRAGRQLAPSRGPGQHARRPRSAPGDPRRLGGRRGVRDVGRQDPADGGRVGVRRARRARGEGLHLGRRVRPTRPDDGQHLAGRVSLAEHARRQVRGHVAGRLLPAQRLRPVRHGRQRLGVDVGLLHAEARRATTRLLRAGDEPPDHLTRRRATRSAGRARPSRAGSRRAARTSARRTTACATGRRPARPRRSTRPPATSASAAWSVRRADPVPFPKEACADPVRTPARAILGWPSPAHRPSS